MKKESQSWKPFDNFKGLFLIITVFALDCLFGNMYKIIGDEDYINQVHQYVSFKEMFNLVPYLLMLIFTMKIQINFDKYDLAILFCCLVLQLLNCIDFFLNLNYRSTWSDWVIFFSVAIPAISLKMKHYIKKITI